MGAQTNHPQARDQWITPDNTSESVSIETKTYDDLPVEDEAMVEESIETKTYDTSDCWGMDELDGDTAGSTNPILFPKTDNAVEADWLPWYTCC